MNRISERFNAFQNLLILKVKHPNVDMWENLSCVRYYSKRNIHYIKFITETFSIPLQQTIVSYIF